MSSNNSCFVEVDSLINLNNNISVEMSLDKTIVIFSIK